MSAYRRILVAVDGSAASERGLREALCLAKAQRARLFILHVVNEFFAYDYMEGAAVGVDVMALLREAGRRILARAQAAARRSHRARQRRRAAGEDGERARTAGAGRKAVKRTACAGSPRLSRVAPFRH